MKKEEFIARYGEEKWEEHLNAVREGNRRKRAGLLPQKRECSRYWKNNVTVKLWLPIPDMEEYDEQLKENERRATELQKQMRKGWVHETTKDFILIVTAGNKYKDKIGYIVDLYQLNMDKDTQRKFKEFCRRSWEV
jgi:hypothetical protein